MHPPCKRSPRKHTPQVLPATLTEKHLDGEARPDLTTASSERQLDHIEPAHRGSHVNTANSQWRKQQQQSNGQKHASRNKDILYLCPGVDVEVFLPLMASELNLQYDGKCAEGRGLGHKLLTGW